MKLKPSLRNSARAALLFNLALCLLFLSGCTCQIQPTYKEENIPSAIEQLCRDEYKINLSAKREGNSLWVYVSNPKFLNREYGKKEEKIFNEEEFYKLNNILTVIGRVLTSADKTPDFFALTASDSGLGFDYTLIGSTLDLKKAYAGAIPWAEINRRYVVHFNVSPMAVGDKTGAHLVVYDIKWPDFLAEQITQRIGNQFQGENLNKYFKINKLQGIFNKNAFIFEYSIEKSSSPPQKIDIQQEIVKIVSFCLKTYEFKNFSLVEIRDLLTRENVILSRAQVWATPLY